MSNWNDRFRGFIRYANYLHGIGVLDVILATGDIVDYLFEEDDDPSSGGNALFARNVLLGLVPSERFPDVEELRVPIFIVPGNHDYRMNPYPLLFNLDFGPFNVRQLTSFEGYKMNWHDAVAVQGGNVPNLSADTAGRGLEIDKENRSFKTHLADKTNYVDDGGVWHAVAPHAVKTNYVVRLGSHRIVMLDSGWDVELPESKLDLIIWWFGGLSEGKRNAVSGTPNSNGVSDDMVGLVAETLTNTPDEGLFIVGSHAPLFNLWLEEYPYFLRETQRNDQRAPVYDWLRRQALRNLQRDEATLLENSYAGTIRFGCG